MSTLIIQLPDELKDRLTAEARRLRKRPAELVTEALEARLQNGESAMFTLASDFLIYRKHGRKLHPAHLPRLNRCQAACSSRRHRCPRKAVSAE